MLNKLRNKEGFTLIELLIVVAIIGILAAIAIPQFSAYRIRGYNSSALSDLNNIKLAENGFNQDSGGVFASSEAAGLAGAGAAVDGPKNIVETVKLGTVNGFPTDKDIDFKFGISNGVTVVINSTPVSASEFLIGTAHAQGNETYLFDSDSTANRKLAAGRVVGTKMVVGDVPASASGTDELTAATYTTI